MREIKFRAWMSPDKYMLSHDELMKIPVIYHDVFEGNSKYPCMQYTGIKDKKGVEIYEGDIMKAKRHNFEDYDICVIVYRPISFVFEVQSEKGNYIAPRNWHQHFEVIGNIYENSELLK